MILREKVHSLLYINLISIVMLHIKISNVKNHDCLIKYDPCEGLKYPTLSGYVQVKCNTF